MATTTLPESFRDLERFASWALPTQLERNRKRLSSDMAEIREFYDGMLARLDDVVAHLNQFPLERLPAKELQLMLLALSLIEVAPAVECFGEPDITYAEPADRLTMLDFVESVKGADPA